MKSIIFSILIAMFLVVGAILWVNKNNLSPSVDANNVSVVDGMQIVQINAKGGYQPRKSVAKSGIPTVIRFDTNGTFDCSSSVRIPGMDISKILPQTGVTDIDIGSQEASVLQGSCGMGMYPFEIEFTS